VLQRCKRKPQRQEKYFSYPTNQPAQVAMKVGAVTPLAVVVTPLVWVKITRTGLKGEIGQNVSLL